MHSVVGILKCIMNRACIFGVAFNGVMCLLEIEGPLPEKDESIKIHGHEMETR